MAKVSLNPCLFKEGQSTPSDGVPICVINQKKIFQEIIHYMQNRTA